MIEGFFLTGGKVALIIAGMDGSSFLTGVDGTSIIGAVGRSSFLTGDDGAVVVDSDGKRLVERFLRECLFELVEGLIVIFPVPISIRKLGASIVPLSGL